MRQFCVYLSFDKFFLKSTVITMTLTINYNQLTINYNGIDNEKQPLTIIYNQFKIINN